jgi:multicomponent K+:H+ antiporter subunit D
VLAAAAAPVKRYTDATAAQLADKGAYARAVLDSLEGGRIPSTRPYRGGEGEVRLPARGDSL